MEAFFPTQKKHWLVLWLLARDEQGSVVFTASCVMRKCRDAEEAEALAAYEAVNLALCEPNKPVIYKTDCTSLYHKLCSRARDKFIANIIEEIKVFVLNFPGSRVRCNRERSK